LFFPAIQTGAAWCLRGEQAVAQNTGGISSRVKAKISGPVPDARLAAHPCEDIEQFPALTAMDGLHVAIQAAVGPAGNVA